MKLYKCHINNVQIPISSNSHLSHKCSEFAFILSDFRFLLLIIVEIQTEPAFGFGLREVNQGF